MKKSVLFTLAAVMLLSSLSAKDTNFPMIRQIVELVELDSTFIEELILGMHPDVAITCKEGTTLPLKFLHKSDLFSIKYAPDLVLKIEQPFYLRYSGKKVYFSRDLASWENAAKILEGKPDINVSIDAESGITIESSITSSP